MPRDSRADAIHGKLAEVAMRFDDASVRTAAYLVLAADRRMAQSQIKAASLPGDYLGSGLVWSGIETARLVTLEELTDFLLRELR